MGGVRTEHMVKNKINSLMRTVFKKKFKVITASHIASIVETLRRKANIQAAITCQNNESSIDEEGM
jgi:hypothetical protein